MYRGSRLAANQAGLGGEMSWLEAAMKHRGITYGELSRRSGISKSEIWAIALKNRDPRLSTLRKLSLALDMPLAEMIDGGDGQVLAEWYFDILSEQYGGETFGPFVSRGAAERAIANAKFHAGEVPDTIRRAYTDPYTE